MLKTEKFKPDARLLISCFTHEYQWLLLLKNKDKPYEPLLDYLYDLGKHESISYQNHDRKKHQCNTIGEAININPSKIKNWLTTILNDILELNSQKPELFSNENQYHYILSFNHMLHWFSGFHIWLPLPLSRLDKFEFYFARCLVDCSNFWVKEITHSYEYGKNNVFIELDGSFPNLYRDILLDKVEFLREISLLEMLHLTSFQLDEKLREYGRKEKL